MRFRVPVCLAIRAASVVWMSALALLASGCAHADTVADRKIAEMGETIGKVQAEQDRAVRGFDPDPMSAPVKAPPPAPAAAAPGVTRTVQIGEGDDARESDDPNDPTARPEIRLHGSPGAASRAGGRAKRPRGDGRIDSADDAAGESGQRPSEPRGDAVKRTPRTHSNTNDTRGSAGPKESR